MLGLSKPVNKAKMGLSECSCPIYAPGPGRGKLDLIPSTLQIVNVEMKRAERKLNTFLETKVSGYDYVIIDCPPTISLFTEAAILASGKYVVPIKPDPLSVVGLPLLERWLEDFIEDHGIKLKPVGLIFSLVRTPTPGAMRDVMEDLKSKRSGEIFGTSLTVSTDVVKSSGSREPIFLHKPRSKSAQQIKAITEEFLKRDFQLDRVQLRHRNRALVPHQLCRLVQPL